MLPFFRIRLELFLASKLQDASHGNLLVHNFYSDHGTLIPNMQDFEVPTDALDESVLSNIREELAGFLTCEVINKKGEFHCANPASSMA